MNELSVLADLSESVTAAKESIAAMEKERNRLAAKQEKLALLVGRLMELINAGQGQEVRVATINMALQIRVALAEINVAVSPGHNIAALRRLQRALNEYEREDKS